MMPATAKKRALQEVESVTLADAAEALHPGIIETSRYVRGSIKTTVTGLTWLRTQSGLPYHSDLTLAHKRQ